MTISMPVASANAGLALPMIALAGPAPIARTVRASTAANIESRPTHPFSPDRRVVKRIDVAMSRPAPILPVEVTPHGATYAAAAGMRE
jgi:hypothetical protein